MKNSLRILILEDVPSQALIIEEELRCAKISFSSKVVATKEHFIKSLEDFRPDIILSAYTLPNFNGMEALGITRELLPNTPFIIVTGSRNEEVALECIKAGADDYVIKDHLIRLSTAVAGALIRKQEREAKENTEEALRNASAQWRKTFDSLDDMILHVDKEYKICRVNKATTKTLGLSYEDLLGQKCFKLLDGREGPTDYCPHKLTLNDGESHSNEIYNDHLNKHYYVTSNPLFDDSGSLTGAIHVMRDITDRKQLEVQALQYEKMASVGQLAAGVAHEINNPTAFVMANMGLLNGYVDNMFTLLGEVRILLKASADDALIEKLDSLEEKLDMEYIRTDVKDLISESHEGLIRIRNIVADLRSFSSVGKDEVEEVNINEVVTSAINMTHSAIKYRGKLEKSLDNVPRITGIRGRLAQAVLNILANAAHALDENLSEKNMISVSTGTLNNRIYVRISDTGSGIPLESFSKVFTPFYTTKPAGKGTGLGLAISQNIVQEHGGSISIESKVGKGSTFTIWLPVNTALESINDKGHKASDDETILNRAKVLVVDDEKLMLKTMNRLLSPFFQITLAGSAGEALKIIKQDSSFDLILSDLVMPEMNGQSLYNKVVEQWPQLEPRFIFFTAGSYPPQLREFSRKMKERTIHKPFLSEKMLSFIKARLENRNENQSIKS